MNKETARRIADLMIKHGDELVQSLHWIEDNSSDEEIAYYRDIISKLMTDMLIEVMNPIYRLYPELTPEGLTVPHCHNSCKIHSKVGFGKPNAAINKKE